MPAEEYKSKRSILANHLRFLCVLSIPIALSLLLVLPRSYTPTYKTPLPNGTNVTLHVDEVKFGYQLGWVYVFFVIGLLWMTNILPVPVTGYMPLVIFPLLGTVQSKQLADIFMNNVNMMNFGTIVIVLAMNGCGLRERITARILKHSLGSLRRIFVFTFYATIAIAMWLGGAAATFLMLYVVEDIHGTLLEGTEIGTLGEDRMIMLHEILKNGEGPDKNQKAKNDKPVAEKDYEGKENEEEPTLQTQENADETAEKTSTDNKDVKPLDTSNTSKEGSSGKEAGALQRLEDENNELLNVFGGELLYAIGAAANIGATLWPFTSPMGCELFKLKYTFPSNFTQKDTFYGWTEATWFMYSLPLAIVNAAIVLSLLTWIHFSNSASSIRKILKFNPNRLCDIRQNKDILKNVSAMFSEKHAQLKPLTFQENGIISLTILLIVLCLTRLPVFATGWAQYIGPKLPKNITLPAPNDPRVDVADSVPLIVVILLMCFIPKQGIGIFKGPTGPKGKPNSEGLVGWKNIQSNFPWAIMVLIGGSNLVGQYAEKTVAEPIASIVPKSSRVPLQLVMVALTIVSTQFICNPGASILIMHIWTLVAKAANVRAVLILPVMSVASLCFMIPTSSVPTAIVYRYKGQKKLSAWYFLKIGTLLFVCTLIVTVVYILVWTADNLTAIKIQ